MTKDEALKLALEALEGVLDDSPKVLDASIAGGLYEVVQCRDAITAIKEALALAEQEPVAWLKVVETPGGWGKFVEAKPNEKGVKPVYTSPPAQRTWVGLTDDEIKEIHHLSFGKDIAIATGLTEAKLKEKNT